MSKFNSGLNPYLLSTSERIININGPQCAELIRWYYIARDSDSLVEQESYHVLQKLMNGPSFEDSHQMVLSLQDIKNIYNWKNFLDDENPITKEVDELLDKVLNPKNE